jgi:hypothetical protein
MKVIATILCILLGLSQVIAHPLKMAYTAVKFNPEKQVFEISQRVFQDDFEMTLEKNYGYKGGDVFTNQKSAATLEAVNVFFDKNFSISFDGKKLKHRYIRTEQKHDMGIIIYYETEKIDAANIKSIKIYNFIMMESFKEQVNMLNINIDDIFKRTIKFEVRKQSAFIKI